MGQFTVSWWKNRAGRSGLSFFFFFFFVAVPCNLTLNNKFMICRIYRCLSILPLSFRGRKCQGWQPACLTPFVAISACMSCLVETVSDLLFKVGEELASLMLSTSNSFFAVVVIVVHLFLFLILRKTKV